MSSLVVPAAMSILNDNAMSGSSSPRAGGPSRRRSFTPAQKLEHVTAYEQGLARGEGGAYLRREGLYSSLMSQWRRLCDAGVLAGKQPGARGRPPECGPGGDRPAASRAGRGGAEAGHQPDRVGHHGKSARALGASLREREARAAARRR
jgi:hypothetical protein